MRAPLMLLLGFVLGGCSSSTVNPGGGGTTGGTGATSGGASGAGGAGGGAGSGCADLGGGLLGDDGSAEVGLGQWYAVDGTLEHAQTLAACGTKSIRIHTSAQEAPSARHPVSASAVLGKTYTLSFCLRSQGVGRDVTVDAFSDDGVGTVTTVNAPANAWAPHTVPSVAFPTGGSPTLRFAVESSTTGSDSFIDCVNLIEM